MSSIDKRKNKDLEQCAGGKLLGVEMTNTPITRMIYHPDNSIHIDTSIVIGNRYKEKDKCKKLNCFQTFEEELSLLSFTNYIPYMNTGMCKFFKMLMDQKIVQFSSTSMYICEVKEKLILKDVEKKQFQDKRKVQDSHMYGSYETQEHNIIKYELEPTQKTPDKCSSEAKMVDDDISPAPPSSSDRLPFSNIHEQCNSYHHENDNSRQQRAAGSSGDPGGGGDDDDDNGRDRSSRNHDKTGPKRKTSGPDKDSPPSDEDAMASEEGNAHPCKQSAAEATTFLPKEVTHNESSNDKDQSDSSDELVCFKSPLPQTSNTREAKVAVSHLSSGSPPPREVTQKCEAESFDKESSQEEAVSKSKEVNSFSSVTEDHSSSKEGTSNSQTGDANCQGGSAPSKGHQPEHKEQLSPPSKSPLSAEQDEDPSRPKKRQPHNTYPKSGLLQLLAAIIVLFLGAFIAFIAFTVLSNHSAMMGSQNVIISDTVKIQKEVIDLVAKLSLHIDSLQLRMTPLPSQTFKPSCPKLRDLPSIKVSTEEMIKFSTVSGSSKQCGKMSECLVMNPASNITFEQFCMPKYSTTISSQQKTPTASLSTPVVDNSCSANKTTPPHLPSRGLKGQQSVNRHETNNGSNLCSPLLPPEETPYSQMMSRQVSLTAATSTREESDSQLNVLVSQKVYEPKDKVCDWLIRDSTNNKFVEECVSITAAQNYTATSLHVPMQHLLQCSVKHSNDTTQLPVSNVTSESNPLQQSICKFPGRHTSANVRQKDKPVQSSIRLSGPSSNSLDNIIQDQIFLVVIILSVSFTTIISHHPNILKMLTSPRPRARRRYLKHCRKLYTRAVSDVNCVLRVQPANFSCKWKAVFTLAIFMSLISNGNINDYASNGDLTASNLTQTAARQLDIQSTNHLCNSTVYYAHAHVADVQHCSQDVLPKVICYFVPDISRNEQVENTQSMIQIFHLNYSLKCSVSIASNSFPVLRRKMKKKHSRYKITPQWSGGTLFAETVANQSCPLMPPLLIDIFDLDNICKGHNVAVLVLEQKRKKVKKKSISTSHHPRNYRIYRSKLLPCSSELLSDLQPVVKQKQPISVVSRSCFMYPLMLTSSGIKSGEKHREALQDNIQDTVKKKFIINEKQDDTLVSEWSRVQTCFFTDFNVQKQCAGSDTKCFVMIDLEQSRTKVKKKDRSSHGLLPENQSDSSRSSWFPWSFKTSLSSTSLLTDSVKLSCCMFQDHSNQDHILGRVKKKVQQSCVNDYNLESLAQFDTHNMMYVSCLQLHSQITEHFEAFAYLFSVPFAPQVCSVVVHDICHIHTLFELLLEQNQTKARKKDTLYVMNPLILTYSESRSGKRHGELFNIQDTVKKKDSLTDLVMLTCSLFIYGGSRGNSSQDHILGRVKKKVIFSSQPCISDYYQERFTKLCSRLVKHVTSLELGLDDNQFTKHFETPSYLFSAPLASEVPTGVGHNICNILAQFELLLEQNQTKARKKGTPLQLFGEQQSSRPCSDISFSKVHLAHNVTTKMVRNNISQTSPQSKPLYNIFSIIPWINRFLLLVIAIIIVPFQRFVFKCQFHWYSQTWTFILSDGIDFNNDDDSFNDTESSSADYSDTNDSEAEQGDDTLNNNESSRQVVESNLEGGRRTLLALYPDHGYRVRVRTTQEDEERTDEQEAYSSLVIVHGTAVYSIQPETTNQDDSMIQLSTPPFSNEIEISDLPPTDFSNNYRRLNSRDLRARISRSELGSQNHHYSEPVPTPAPLATNVSYHIPDPNITNPGYASVGVLVEGEVNLLEQSSVPYRENSSSYQLFEPGDLLGLIRSITMLLRFRCDRICQVLRSSSPELVNVNYNTMERIVQRISVIAHKVCRIRVWWDGRQSEFHSLASHDQARYVHQFQREKYQVSQLLQHHHQQLERIERKMYRQLQQIRRDPFVDVQAPPSHITQQIYHSIGPAHSPLNDGAPAFFPVALTEAANSDLVSLADN